MQKLIGFIKNWTLPLAIAIGSCAYLTFYYVPILDKAGDRLLPFFESVLPVLVFLMLLFSFCRIDFRQMRLHKWHIGVLVGQIVLIGINVGIILWAKSRGDMSNALFSPLVWEAILTCVIAPTAAAASVVVGKLGGNVSTMTCFILLSSLVSALLIPIVFPILEPSAAIGFLQAFITILTKVFVVLLLPLGLGWLLQRYAPTICTKLAAYPNLGFYCWSITLSITTGLTIKNIMHSDSSLWVLLMIGLMTLLLSLFQFFMGRTIGRTLGEEVNAGQALFQKNTALSIWVSYLYLHPVASIGAGCYVLWQNIINAIELRYTRVKH